MFRSPEGAPTRTRPPVPPATAGVGRDGASCFSWGVSMLMIAAGSLSCSMLNPAGGRPEQGI
eukprot:5576634-Prymnesium_polylepis.2